MHMRDDLQRMSRYLGLKADRSSRTYLMCNLAVILRQCYVELIHLQKRVALT